MATHRRFEGAERAEMHAKLLQYMDLGFFAPITDVNEADVIAADLVRVDPSLLTDRLGPEFGPRLEIRGIHETSSHEDSAAPTSGTWCMFAAERVYKRVLEVAYDAGISMDDPAVFLKGGLLTYSRWIHDPELVKFALKLSASALGDVQQGMFDTKSPGTTVHILSRLIENEPSHINICKNALKSIKLILESGASIPEAQSILAIVEKKFGVGERGLVMASIMRGSIAMTRETGSPEPENTPAPKRARVRV